MVLISGHFWKLEFSDEHHRKTARSAGTLISLLLLPLPLTFADERLRLQHALVFNQTNRNSLLGETLLSRFLSLWDNRAMDLLILKKDLLPVRL